MPDWSALVRAHLKLTSLSEETEREIIAELAAHLNDLQREYRAQGLGDSQAAERALSEVTDWRAFAQSIQRAKCAEEPMNSRTKQLWLPGLINLTTAMLVLLFEVHQNLNPWIYTTHSLFVPVYLPWLVSLPLCGALSAYLCRRAGGDLMARLTTAAFPAVAYLACFALVFLITLFGTHTAPLTAFAVVVCGWVVVPAAASLLGALPFLGGARLLQR